LLFSLMLPSFVWAADTWTTPFPGIRRLRRITSNQSINVLLIDLCRAGVSLRATASSERRRTVPSFGALVGAHAAINGDFFNFNNYNTDGMSMSAGALWPGTADHGYVTPIAIGAKRIEIPHHNNITPAQPWMREIVSGHPTLLDDGMYVGNQGDPLCTNRHPRTAVGITQDHKTMIWAVVDGRASTRIGMTCQETAALLREFQGWDAVNLDGGGSSTMWLQGVGVVNQPSDGSARTVANHLAVYARGSGDAAHCPCVARCNGSRIIGADCGEGDCAVFGATCVNDNLGVRCASVFCPAQGVKKVCVNEKLIGDCKDGGITTGDCSAFAAYCSTAGASEARCVSVFCVKDAQSVPVAHDTCLPDGRRVHCNAQGGISDKPCPQGTRCVLQDGVGRCIDPNQPPAETTTEATPERAMERQQEASTPPDEEALAPEEPSEEQDPAEAIAPNEGDIHNDASSLEDPQEEEAVGGDPLYLDASSHDRAVGDVLHLMPIPSGCGCSQNAMTEISLLFLATGMLGLRFRRRRVGR
jgi:hypothetical protein